MYKQIISLLTTIFLSVTSVEIGLGKLNNGNVEEVKSQIVSTAKINSSNAVTDRTVNVDKPQQTSKKVIAAAAVKTTTAPVKTTSAKAASVKAAAPSNTTAKTQAAPAKTAAPAASNEALGTADIDTSNSGRGIVGVKYTHSSGEKIKVIVNKSGSKYTYNLNSLTGFEYFPLQMGNGDYTVTIYKNISGTSYSTIKSYNLNVNLSNSSIVYLNSIQNIKWTSSTNAVAKARSLASGKGSTEAKVKSIYEYVVTNIKYDRSKVNTLSYSYVPSVSATFSTGKGVCYDFASTFAAMLRGVSIPTRLVMGNSVNANGYHAWNEVLINGNWVIIDTSYDSQLKQVGRSYSMIKSSSQYSKTKQY